MAGTPGVMSREIPAQLKLTDHIKPSRKGAIHANNNWNSDNEVRHEQESTETGNNRRRDGSISNDGSDGESEYQRVR